MSTAAVVAQLAETGTEQVAIAAVKVTIVVAAILSVPLGVFIGLARSAATRHGEPDCPWCDDGVDKSLCYCMAPCGRGYCPTATGDRNA